MAASTVASLVNNLANSSDKLNSLEELKTLVTSISPHELRNVVPNVSILPVFECLNTDNTTQQEVCCQVLDRLLSSLSSALILENLHGEIVRWLGQGAEPVQLLCLSQLLRVSADSPELLRQSSDLLVGVTGLLASPSQNVSCLATTILVNIGFTNEGLETVYSGPVFDTLLSAMNTDDTNRYRVYQLVVQLSTASPQAMEMGRGSGLLVKLINEMQTGDILLQLNCLELLSDLAQTAHGLTFLQQEGVVRKLEEMMLTADSSPYGAYLLPGLMKFFGGLARFHPKEVLNHFHIFLNMVFAAIGDQGDPSVQGLAVDTIGFIGSTPEGKSALDKQGNMMTECMGNLGKLVKNSPSDMRSRALNTLASLLKLEVADQTQELLAITEAWFSRLCSNPFDCIWSIAKQPFADLRTPALAVLQSLAEAPWGQGVMNNCAGFKEYLLDRSLETGKEAKEAKFRLVAKLASAPTAATVLGRPYCVLLAEYVRQGPFYVVAQSQVAYDEG